MNITHVTQTLINWLNKPVRISRNAARTLRLTPIVLAAAIVLGNAALTFGQEALLISAWTTTVFVVKTVKDWSSLLSFIIGAWWWATKDQKN